MLLLTLHPTQRWKYWFLKAIHLQPRGKPFAPFLIFFSNFVYTPQWDVSARLVWFQNYLNRACLAVWSRRKCLNNKLTVLGINKSRCKTLLVFLASWYFSLCASTIYIHRNRLNLSAALCWNTVRSTAIPRTHLTYSRADDWLSTMKFDSPH